MAQPGLVFHPGGRYLITENRVEGNDRLSPITRLWDTESERSLPFPGSAATVRSAAWSPDGHALAVGLKDGDVIVAGFPGGDGPTHIPFPGHIRRLVLHLAPTLGAYLAIAGEKSAPRLQDVRAGTFATPSWPISAW